ncbi:MAG: ABC transporter ATP-binding protein [Acetatifactor sp.]|nr:ABC transporter ATP-binding protein [Acetatifactor sp.]
MDIVSVNNLTKIYKQGTDEVYAVDRAGFCIKKGEFVAIIGQSGSGKTTLLNLIGGIEHPTSGSVQIDGVDIHTIDDNTLAGIRRRKIGYIFQDFNLLPILTAKENIIMPLLLDSKKVDEDYLQSLVDLLGIKHRLKHLPSQLSGGQKQRVAIARALINHPSIILADEPTGNLDKKTADEIMNLLIEINRRGNTVLLVTHEERYADMCSRKIVLSDGRIQ